MKRVFKRLAAVIAAAAMVVAMRITAIVGDDAVTAN